MRRMLNVTRRSPGGRLNVCGEARTYGDRLARVFRTTPPVLRFWIHGRTLIVTRIVSLVVFLTVIVPTAPRLAVRSTDAGVMDTPPCCAACATGADSSARAMTLPVAVPATARPRAPATSRLLTSFTSVSPCLYLIRGACAYGVSVESVTSSTLR